MNKNTTITGGRGRHKECLLEEIYENNTIHNLLEFNLLINEGIVTSIMQMASGKFDFSKINPTDVVFNIIKQSATNNVPLVKVATIPYDVISTMKDMVRQNVTNDPKYFKASQILTQHLTKTDWFPKLSKDQQTKIFNGFLKTYNLTMKNGKFANQNNLQEAFNSFMRVDYKALQDIVEKPKLGIVNVEAIDDINKSFLSNIRSILQNVSNTNLTKNEILNFSYFNEKLKDELSTLKFDAQLEKLSEYYKNQGLTTPKSTQIIALKAMFPRDPIIETEYHKLVTGGWANATTNSAVYDFGTLPSGRNSDTYSSIKLDDKDNPFFKFQRQDAPKGTFGELKTSNGSTNTTIDTELTTNSGNNTEITSGSTGSGGNSSGVTNGGGTGSGGTPWYRNPHSWLYIAVAGILAVTAIGVWFYMRRKTLEKVMNDPKMSIMEKIRYCQNGIEDSKKKLAKAKNSADKQKIENQLKAHEDALRKLQNQK